MNTELFKTLEKLFGAYRLKGVKTFPSHDVGGVYGSIYRGKKVGSFHDDGWGGGIQVSFINEEEHRLFQEHAQNVTPTDAKSYEGKILFTTPNEIGDLFLGHLISVWEQIRSMQSIAKKNALVALDKNKTEISDFGHLKMDTFAYFKLMPQHDPIKALEHLEKEHPELIFLNADLVAWK